MYRYVLFDAANTLIHKPAIATRICAVLAGHGVTVDARLVSQRHRLVSELVTFPDRTGREFYAAFNAELLLALGVVPTDSLLDELFSACAGLAWEPFADTSVLTDIELPFGVLSNFNAGLGGLLGELFDVPFAHVITSEAAGLRKPDVRLFHAAAAAAGVAPAEIVYVGDSPKLDIRPALAAGMGAVLIDRDDQYPGAGDRIARLTDLVGRLE